MDKVLKIVVHILFAFFNLAFTVFLLSHTAIAQETSGDFSGGSVRYGYDNRTCDGTQEGAIRFGTVPTQGLVGHWRLDESSGNLADSSGFGNDGVASGGPTYSPTGGQVKGALDFDATDDVVTINHDGVLDDLDTITIAAWIKPNSDGEGGVGRIVDKSPVNNDFLLFMFDDYFHFQARRWDGNEGNWRLPDSSLTFGVWQHVAVTYNYGSTANNPVMYVNGASVTVTENTAPTGSVASTPGEMFIGNSDDGASTFDGLIDDVRIYNRVLSATEIDQIYDYGVAGGNGQVLQYCNGSNWVDWGG